MTLATLSGLWALTWPLLAQTPDRCPSPVAEIVSAQGSIEVTLPTQNVSSPASLNTLLCPGDSIRVGQRSRAAILVLDTGAVIRIDQLTTLQIVDPSSPGRSILNVLIGVIHFFSRLPQSLEVRTPFVTAGVEGTEFVVRVEQNRTLVSVFEGRVRLTNDQGALLVTSNQSAEAVSGQAPQLRLVVQPRDGIQWAVYYQPVLTPTMDSSLPATVQNLALRESLGALSRGEPTEAFDALNRIPNADRNESFYVHRAGLRLAVGRVDEARSDLDQALALSPENADVYALLAIIAVTQNDPEQALFNGHEAVARSP
ncbi:MAG: FecR domain-containing protein, partial [Acidobacteria bacterium]|nr:FecR domain-containing protein [Acidobacteriota bacterium]